ncbi:dna repair protein xp-c / rad4 [Holotrichia oblita]|uniref:Dna repair protein xp-c / rad4 n=1 Tax=Holotrichia oblita TaxID=644536 RepID=A0ACB9TNJ1_HOLOL|nr:dna repair protein xp-c / rad4 [Holotrichia oblita]
MIRTRARAKRSSPVSEISDDAPKTKKRAVNVKVRASDCSSSESDIETYLKPASEIDLNSSFFQTQTNVKKSFEEIEKNIFSGINRLSESDTEDEFLVKKVADVPQASVSTKDKLDFKERVIHFEHIHAYNKKMEEAKKHVELYKAKKNNKENSIDVADMLAVGETKIVNDNLSMSAYSSDFETYSDSEKDEWEEINSSENVLIPKKGVEITVELPGNVRKKKRTDIMDAIKRKINRVKKENQVYIHKVHLLCWIAHGIYLNKILNSENLMGLALSLLPSQKCYPSERLNISYLEEILQWYRKTITISKCITNKEKSLERLIEKQIMNKEAYDYKFFVYIFVCLLRSLGIRCRLMLSLEVEPLRPSATELCSLSKADTTDNQNKNTAKKVQVDCTPKASLSKKATSSKVISTKKVSHSSKISKIKEMKVKKLDFEDLCLLRSTDEIKGNTTIIKEPTSSKICTNFTESKIKTNKSGNSKKESKTNGRKNERAQKTNNKLRETEKVESSNIKKRPNSATIKQSSTKHTRVKENQTKTHQDRQKKIKIESNVAEKRKACVKTNTENEVEHFIAKETSTNLTYSTIDKSIQFNEEKKGSRISENDTKMEIQLRRSQRLSKSPENLNVIESIFNQENETQTNSNTIIKSDKTNKFNNKDNEAKNKLSAFKVKMPFKLKYNTKKLSDANEKSSEMTDTTENEMQIVVPQLDGGNDEIDSKPSKNNKANLRKLKDISLNKCLLKEHPKRLKKTVKYTEECSDDDFQGSDVSSKKIVSKEKKHGKSSINQIPRKIHSKTSNIVERELSSISSTSRHFPNALGNKLDVRNDIIGLLKKNISEEKQLQRSKLVKHKRMSKSYSDSDGDYIPKSARKMSAEDDFKEKSVTVKRRIPMKKDLIEIEKISKQKKKKKRKRKVLMFGSKYLLKPRRNGLPLMSLKAKCIASKKYMYTRATHPISYILSWDNDHSIKDLTKRYCLNWNTVTRKLRVDDKWWNETLLPYKPPRSARDREEDEDLARQQLEQPLPTTISEFKNHPLYVIKRHLLKFEAIYPPDALILGFVRNEPIYSRDCVHVLHSRDIWLKHAKVVKPGEKPYKIVKARPKYDKLSNSIITDQPLEIFGKWQVEDYVPPTAENGVVPRNAYGNVELFKTSMLPKGTVHLQLPGLNKIARKMNIDCAPAIVGFDFHGGWSHPTYDGFIVCEEFSEQLIAAWYQEQEESEKRAQEKIEKRVYDNWRRLIRGLLIRERLKAKYDFGESSTVSKSRKSKKGLILKKKKVHSDTDSD